jgi:hypothetical protein
MSIDARMDPSAPRFAMRGAGQRRGAALLNS